MDLVGWSDLSVQIQPIHTSDRCHTPTAEHSYSLPPPPFPIQATLLTSTLTTPVLTHTTKKPGCHDAVLNFFLSDPTTGVTHPSQIAIVGDRLFTDVMMANMMGAWGIWIRDGVPEVGGAARKSFFGGVERWVEGALRGRGLRPGWPGEGEAVGGGGEKGV